MLTQDLISDKFSKIVKQSPAKVIVNYNNIDYPAIKTSLKKGIKYSDFGTQTGYDFSVYLTIKDLPSIPENEEKITIKGKVYRVLDKEIDSTNTSVMLHLGNEYE
jgi:hypothetical protein